MVVLSFDLYCLLLEYSILGGQIHLAEEYHLEDLLFCDDLMIETPHRQLQVVIDFLAHPNSKRIC